MHIVIDGKAGFDTVETVYKFLVENGKVEMELHGYVIQEPLRKNLDAGGIVSSYKRREVFMRDEGRVAYIENFVIYYNKFILIQENVMSNVNKCKSD